MSVDDLSITSVLVDRVMHLYHREILRVHREDTLVVVSRQFERKRTAVGMVVDDGDHLVGIVSLGDIVHAIGEHGAGAVYLPVRMIMSYDPLTCEPSEAAESSVKKMTEYDVKHLPVVDDGKLIGCIEKIDVLEALYSEAELDFNQLRNYIFKTGGRYDFAENLQVVGRAAALAFLQSKNDVPLVAAVTPSAVGRSCRPQATARYTPPKCTFIIFHRMICIHMLSE